MNIHVPEEIKKKYDGVSQFVADKRGIPNIYWKDKGSAFQKKLDLL